MRSLKNLDTEEAILAQQRREIIAETVFFTLWMASVFCIMLALVW